MEGRQWAAYRQTRGLRAPVTATHRNGAHEHVIARNAANVAGQCRGARAAEKVGLTQLAAADGTRPVALRHGIQRRL